MLLQLQRYDVQVNYKAGKEMVLAYTLSRAHLTGERTPDDSKEEILTFDMEDPIKLDSLPVSRESTTNQVQVSKANGKAENAIKTVN